MKSCDGKLSTWFGRETHNKGKILSNTCLLTSTVIPLEHKNVGSYSVGIRNSEGSTAVSLYLMYEGMLWYFLSNPYTVESYSFRTYIRPSCITRS
jgi:hypothetical protein